MITAIKPDIQGKILDILPDDGPLALKVMAQLSANMLSSIDDADLDIYIQDIQNNLKVYRLIK